MFHFFPQIPAQTSVKNYKSGFSEWMYKWHEYQDFVDEQRFKQQQDLKDRLGM